MPLVTFARQVAHTPALQAKGAGSPDARALSRIFPAAKGTRRVRPSSVTETVTPSALRPQLLYLERYGFGRPVGGEALDVDPVLRDVAIEKNALGRVHHRTGSANEPAIHVGRIGHQRGYRLLQTLTVEHSVEQFDVLLFLVKEMVDFEPAEMLVFQSCERFEEDHSAAVAIAVEQGEATVRLVFERRS